MFAYIRKIEVVAIKHMCKRCDKVVEYTAKQAILLLSRSGILGFK